MADLLTSLSIVLLAYWVYLLEKKIDKVNHDPRTNQGGGGS